MIGKGVECESIEYDKFNVKQEVAKFLDKGGKLYACGTCMKSRKMEESVVCPLSLMQDLMDIIEESDKVVSF